MAKQSEEDARKRTEDERKRREAQELKDREEQKRKEEKRLKEVEEENERRETKRRNYLLLRERANNRRGSRELEEDLMTEIEREREDKLCCICQDMEVSFSETFISTRYNCCLFRNVS